jgi:hypothetical protein
MIPLTRRDHIAAPCESNAATPTTASLRDGRRKPESEQRKASYIREPHVIITNIATTLI